MQNTVTGSCSMTSRQFDSGEWREKGGREINARVSIVMSRYLGYSSAVLLKMQGKKQPKLLETKMQMKMKSKERNSIVILVMDRK